MTEKELPLTQREDLVKPPPRGNSSGGKKKYMLTKLPMSWLTNVG